jgi:hypothetical protein
VVTQAKLETAVVARERVLFSFLQMHFEASNANVSITKARYMAYIPYDVMDIMLGLGADVTAHHAYALIVPVLVDSGIVEIREPLVELLTMVLIKPSTTHATPITVQTQVGVNGCVPSLSASSYRQEHTMYRDLPGMRSMMDIARSVRDFISKAIDDWTDLSEARKVTRLPHTMRERLSDTIVIRLLLLCRAVDGDFPPLCHKWAARPRDMPGRWVFSRW